MLVVQPALVVTLRKAGALGHAAEKHKYIARYRDPRTHKWKYIMPEHAHGEMLPSGQFKLAAGASIAGLINGVLFGGKTGRILKDGSPEYVQGRFLHYVVVSKFDYAQERNRAAKFGVPNKYSEHALRRETDNRYFVFTYNLVPVTERDVNGKPISFAGFLEPFEAKGRKRTKKGEPRKVGGFEMHPSLHAYGYKPSAFIMSFQTPKTELPAPLEHPARIPQVFPTYVKRTLDEGVIVAVKVGGGSKDGGFKEAASVPAGDSAGIHAVAAYEHETSSPVHLTEKLDPVEYARSIRDKILKRKPLVEQPRGRAGERAATAVWDKRAKKLERRAPGDDVRIAIGDMPDWALVKFVNRQELLDKLQSMPVTTLITLGVYNATGHTKKINALLEEEWRNYTAGRARKDIAAYEHTKAYEALLAQDQKMGPARAKARAKLFAAKAKAGLPTKLSAEEYRELRSDASVHGLKMKKTSDLYQHGVEVMLSVARNYTFSDTDDLSRLDLEIEKKVKTELWRRSKAQASEDGSHLALVDEHMADLAAYEQRHKQALPPDEMAELHRVTPLARTTLLRLFHGDMPETYRRVLEARLSLGSEVTKEPSFEDIAAAHTDWTDPVTGDPVVFASTSTARQKVGQWFKDAIHYTRRKLSVPLIRPEPRKRGGKHIHDVEWKDRSLHVEVEVPDKDLSPEERMVYAAIGQTKKEERVLTVEGKHVKRFLELEAKLAREARRRHGEPDASHMYIPYVPEPVFTPRTRRLLVPSRPIPGGSGSLAPMSIPPLHQPVTHPAVKFFTSSAHQALATQLGLRLDRIGSYAPNPRHPERAPEPSYSAVYDDVGLGLVARKELISAERHYATVQGLQTLKPWKLDKEERKAREQESHLAFLDETSPTGKYAGQTPVAVLHAAAQKLVALRRLAQVRHDSWSTSREKLLAEHYTDAAVKERLKPLQPTKEERSALKDAAAQYVKHVKVVRARVPRAAEVYVSAVSNREEIADSHAAAAANAVRFARRATEGKLSLLAYERNRRETLEEPSVDKSLWNADLLTRAFFDLDFEYARLHAEITL